MSWKSPVTEVSLGESGTFLSHSGICFGQDTMKCEDPGHKESHPSTPPAPRSMRRMVSSRSIRSDMSVSSSGSTFLGQLADEDGESMTLLARFLC